MKPTSRLQLSIGLVWFLAFVAPGATARITTNTAATGTCGPVKVATFEKEKPAVLGKPFTVPRFRIRIVDQNSGESISGAHIHLTYESLGWLSWTWDESDEVSGSIDELDCVTGDDGSADIPEHTVQPVAWLKHMKNPLFWPAARKRAWFEKLEIVAWVERSQTVQSHPGSPEAKTYRDHDYHGEQVFKPKEIQKWPTDKPFDLLLKVH